MFKFKYSSYFIVIVMMSQCYGINLFPESLPQDTQIDSDNGMTCDQQGRLCQAEGNIKVTRGDLILTCKKVQVHFNKSSQTGRQEISKILASRNVRVENKVAHYYATGFQLDYNHTTKTVILKGNPYLNHPKLTIKNAKLITFDSAKSQVIVTGKAIAISDERIIQGDRMIAVFDNSNNSKQLTFKNLTINHNVIISTPSEIARANHGYFNNISNQAELTGNVIITDKNGQILGNKALMDLNTGISQMVDTGGHNNRTKILLIPQNKTNKQRV